MFYMIWKVIKVYNHLEMLMNAKIPNIIAVTFIHYTQTKIHSHLLFLHVDGGAVHGNVTVFIILYCITYNYVDIQLVERMNGCDTLEQIYQCNAPQNLSLSSSKHVFVTLL